MTKSQILAEMPTKTCPKCGEVKLRREFSRDASKRSGLRSTYKECCSTYIAKWNAANPEKRKDLNAKYHADHKEERKAYQSEYRAQNQAQIRVSEAKRRRTNREKRNAGTAKWKASNREAVRIHEHNRRARKREVAGNLSTGLSERLFVLQRGKCACGCKQPLGGDFHLDHIMPLALGGSNADDNIQLLRSLCNMQKHTKHPIDFMQQRGFLI